MKWDWIKTVLLAGIMVSVLVGWWVAADLNFQAASTSKELDRLNDSFEQVLAVAFEKWQPLETAPELESILVYAFQSKRYDGHPGRKYYDTGKVLWQGVARATLVPKSFIYPRKWWIGNAPLAEPIYWMPFPPKPPTADEDIARILLPSNLFNINIRDNTFYNVRPGILICDTIDGVFTSHCKE